MNRKTLASAGRMFLLAALTGAAVANAATVESFTCTPTGVGVGDRGLANERVVVTCSAMGPNGSGANTIKFFAVGTSNADQASRYLSLANGAFLAGRPIAFTYNHTSNTGGCSTSDCRTPLNFTMQ